MSDEPAKPRKSPCASCPYRKNVPSGIWDKTEYEKLDRYDGEIFEQRTDAIFMCHQGCGDVCSGWLGHRDPQDLLAVRLGLMGGHLDPSCANYSTAVPLFESGAAAAEHGMKDIDAPRDAAMAAIGKIATKKKAGHRAKA